MNIIIHPEREKWPAMLKRPYADHSEISGIVNDILREVKTGGDKAVKTYNRKFDGVETDVFQVEEKDIKNAENELSADLKAAIRQADNNIAKFHASQLQTETSVETMPGVKCWRKSIPIEKVGLYIPGGTAPLFSTVLMLGRPAQMAGCKEIILCTPCNKNGKVHPAILFACHIIGIKKIFRIGGAQAIAAMAYGTETVPPVYKIFGPGNRFVTAAKQMVQLDGVAIDMPAGPSEVCVLADNTSNAEYIAADLLSQAEHGADSHVVLVSCESDLIQEVVTAIDSQVIDLPRKEIAKLAISNSSAFLVKNMDEAIDLVNSYAPEHLIISCKNAIKLSDKITNAGSVFIGNYSPESVGDYASGTNHTLPTNGFSRTYSGVSIDSFVKKITFQQLSQEGLKLIAQTVMVMAEEEGLHGHSNSVRVRLKN